MQATTATVDRDIPKAPKAGNLNDQDYWQFLARIQDAFLERVSSGAPLFTTDADGLWDAYLSAFAPEVRQFHNCNSCRHFIERYGALVTIAENGSSRPLLWDQEQAEPEYAQPFEALFQRVRRGKVTGVFLSSDRVLGHPTTGVWRHFSLELPAARVHRHALKTAGQAMPIRISPTMMILAEGE